MINSSDVVYSETPLLYGSVKTVKYTKGSEKEIEILLERGFNVTRIVSGDSVFFGKTRGTPGVPTAIAALNVCGISATHVEFISGDFAAQFAPGKIVVYMQPMKHISAVVHRMADWPDVDVYVVEKCGWPEQRLFSSSRCNVVNDMIDKGIRGPAVVIFCC